MSRIDRLTAILIHLGTRTDAAVEQPDELRALVVRLAGELQAHYSKHHELFQS
ncbi:MAG: hypothetical protein SH819_13285 [Cytophagales bacterium]|nr:hypothetical protein [Cytophagales bacterium]